MNSCKQFIKDGVIPGYGTSGFMLYRLDLLVIIELRFEQDLRFIINSLYRSVFAWYI